MNDNQTQALRRVREYLESCDWLDDVNIVWVEDMISYVLGEGLHPGSPPDDNPPLR